MKKLILSTFCMMFLAGAAWGIPFKHQYFKPVWDKSEFVVKNFAEKWKFRQQNHAEYVRFHNPEMSKYFYIKRHWGHWQDTSKFRLQDPIAGRQTPIEPTPEPAALVLVGVGLCGLSFLIKRKKGKL